MLMGLAPLRRRCRPGLGVSWLRVLSDRVVEDVDEMENVNHGAQLIFLLSLILVLSWYGPWIFWNSLHHDQVLTRRSAKYAPGSDTSNLKETTFDSQPRPACSGCLTPLAFVRRIPRLKCGLVNARVLARLRLCAGKGPMKNHIDAWDELRDSPVRLPCTASSPQQAILVL